MLPDDPEDADPGLARERTRLAWARTAIAFAALGVTVLRKELVGGLVVLAVAPMIWLAGQIAGRAAPPGQASRRLLLVTVTVAGAAILAVAVAFLAHSPASLRDLFPAHGHGR